MSPSGPRPRSGMKTLKRCKSSGEADNIVLIDVDSDSFNNVIIIDVPENITEKLRGSKGSKDDKSCSLRTYIYIDDDENPENHHAGAGLESEFDHGASSSTRYCSATNRSPDTHFSQENLSPVRLSKGKRTYSGRASSNRYGLGEQSDGDSSDDDGPDSEFMEDSSGELRELWERAFLKRKADFHRDQCGRTDHSSASGFSRDTKETEIDKNKHKYAEVPNRSNSKEASHEKEGESPTARVESRWESMFSDPQKSSLDDATLNSKGETHKDADVLAQGESLMDDPPCCHSEQKTCNGESTSHQQPPLFSSNQHTSRRVNQHDGRIPQAKSSSSDPEQSGYVDVCHGKDNLSVDKTSWPQGQCSVENENCSQIGFGQRDGKDGQTPSTSNSPVSSDSEEPSILTGREKLKETDEYKRALEEEWLARQRALKIQAEEAQHLRRLVKRKKAERLRLLDTERRQKQRVEEIRETQKKDEENMNLKELHRAEVTKELKKLGITCRDMASVLRGLGIQVAGGTNPLSHQVRAAYKRALVNFHPDRASGSDLRQQVEAEEKFKFISHMKEKLFPTL